MPAKAKKPAKPAPKPAKPVKKGKAAPKAAKPAKSAKPAPKAAKPAPKAAKPAAKESKSMPKSPSSKTTKSTKTPAAPKPKGIIKKKPLTASVEDKSSVRRTRGKETTRKFVPTLPINKGPIRPVPPKEHWVPPPDMPIGAFTKKQKFRLLDLRDSLMDTLNGVAQETLRMRAEGSEASAFGMHQADAGSDAYDRDFALSLLAKEQDALYEIDEALKRIEAGTYGVCEMSNKRISQPRLEALPFARFTIECQQEYEREVGPNGGRRPVRSLFGLMGSEEDDEENEEETVEKSED